MLWNGTHSNTCRYDYVYVPRTNGAGQGQEGQECNPAALIVRGLLRYQIWPTVYIYGYLTRVHTSLPNTAYSGMIRNCDLILSNPIVHSRCLLLPSRYHSVIFPLHGANSLAIEVVLLLSLGELFVTDTGKDSILSSSLPHPPHRPSTAKTYTPCRTQSQTDPLPMSRPRSGKRYSRICVDLAMTSA